MTEKLSQFTQFVPTPFDYVAGATAGSPNQKFRVSDIRGFTPLAGANLTFYVSTTGSNSNTGTLASPFATVQFAINIALEYDYQGMFGWTVTLAAGDYSGQGDIAFNANGTESNNPFLGGAGTTLTTIGKLTSTEGPLVSFLEYGGFTIKTGSGIAAVWNIGPNAMITSGDITIATSRLDGHMDQLFYATGQTGAVLFGAQTITVNGSITNTQSLTQALFASVEFSGTTLVFPGSAISSGSPQGILFSGFQASVSWNGVSVVNGGNFGAGGQSGFSDIHSNISFDATMSLGNGFFGGLDNTCSVNNSNTNRFLFSGSPPTTGDLVNQSWAVFFDTVNRMGTLARNENGTIFVAAFGHFINTQTGASYTLALPDQEMVVEMNNAGANTLTIPTHASVAFPKGTMIGVVQAGAGATTVAGAGGVTVHNAGALSGQWGTAKLFNRATDEWIQINGSL